MQTISKLLWDIISKLVLHGFFFAAWHIEKDILLAWIGLPIGLGLFRVTRAPLCFVLQLIF